MADEDIYGNKKRYHRFLEHLDCYALPVARRPGEWGKAKYVVRNPVNLRYFRRMVPVFESRDVSYIHRLRLFGDLLIAANATEKDFRDVTREDMDDIVAFMHAQLRSTKTKSDFIKYIRFLWKTLFPVKDEEGHIDDKAFPYPVRHLSAKMDPSKKRMKNDRLTWEDFERLVQYFSDDIRLQAYIMLAMESLGRPQEILTRNVRHVELHDMYAKVWLTERGKEGPGLLQCIDSFPYLARWLEQHPRRNDLDAPLFINTGRKARGERMTPYNVNKHLTNACKQLGISKRVTCYSLKRNGVTFRRLRGDSDMEIQHAARWTTSKQLNTYDLSRQEDAMKRELVKRGIIEADKGSEMQPAQRRCLYCGELNGFMDRLCSKCKRPLDREAIKAEIDEKEQNKKDREMMRRVLEWLGPQIPEHLKQGLTVHETAGGG